MKLLKLAEIATRIDAHLRRFEANPKTNPWDNGKVNGTRPYYKAGAAASGSRVGVRYIAYQHCTYLTKPEAIKYLTWLDAGNVGRHYKALDR